MKINIGPHIPTLSKNNTPPLISHARPHSLKNKEPRVETQGRVLNPISYEKPDLIIQQWCQIQNPLPERVSANSWFLFCLIPGKMIQKRIFFTPHDSRLTPHASRLTPHASRFTTVSPPPRSSYSPFHTLPPAYYAEMNTTICDH